jgi:hypothetical protein
MLHSGLFHGYKNGQQRQPVSYTIQKNQYMFYRLPAGQFLPKLVTESAPDSIGRKSAFKYHALVGELFRALREGLKAHSSKFKHHPSKAKSVLGNVFIYRFS